MKFIVIALMGLLVSGNGQEDCPAVPVCRACINSCNIIDRIGITAYKYEKSLKALNLACKDVKKYGVIDCDQRRAYVNKCQQDLFWDDLYNRYTGSCTYISLDDRCAMWKKKNMYLNEILSQQTLQDYESDEYNKRLDIQDREFQRTKDEYKRYNCAQRHLDVRAFELQQL